jgi:hypothetical protein
VLFAMKRVDEALAYERRSLAVYEAQAAADPTNAAAQNDLAIGYSKMAQLLDATGQAAAGLASQRRATDIHRRLAAADPRSSDMNQELASDYNREATLQAALGLREPSLANHARAVEISRELSAANPTDYEQRFALAQAQAERADAYVRFARSAAGTARAADLAAAEVDYGAALAIYQELERAGTLAGSDKSYVDHARAQLEHIRAERATMK